MMVCAYCGERAPEPPQSCCGEIHFEDVPECPECGSSDIHSAHHEADALAPECDYFACECGHQFNHQ